MAKDTASSGLATQQASRLETLGNLRRLRSEARDEIDRLIAFLDQSDSYVMTELEEGGGDDEPSLGWTSDGRFNLSTDDDREEDAGDSPEHDPAESGIGDEDGLQEQCGRQVL